MTPVLDSYLAEAERVSAERGNDPSWIVRARRDARGRFSELGFPTTRDEEWRFTSVAPIAERPFELADAVHSRSPFTPDGASSLTPQAVDAFRWNGDVAATLVFVNGRFVAAASDVDRLPSGVYAGSIARAVSDPASGAEAHLTRIAALDGQAFTALNSAFLGDGAFVRVPDSVVLRAPIHLLFLTVGGGANPTMSHPRVLVVAGAKSQATIVESYGAVGASQYFTNTVAEVAAGQNATLNYYKVQRESAASFHVGAMYVRAARDANVSSHSIALGGALVRNDINVVLDGEGATCLLNGLYVSDGTRLVDNHTTVEHAQPHCGSREVYKGILADRARAVFNGKIIVRPDAQKTDAKQTNKALLLSEDAQINTKPQLEIFANDVKCTHGAAIGQIDDEAIFYLRARGLSEQRARHMLVHAFAGEVLGHMPLEGLRERIDAELSNRLPEWLA